VGTDAHVRQELSVLSPIWVLKLDGGHIAHAGPEPIEHWADDGGLGGPRPLAGVVMNLYPEAGCKIVHSESGG